VIIERTYNTDIIDSVLKHDDVRPFICDDISAEAPNYPILDNIFYMAVYVDSMVAGMFVLYAINAITLEAHTSMLPKYRGTYSIPAAKKVISWIFKSTGYMKINGSTPVCNERAIAFNKKLGFDVEGINKGSTMRNGKLYDQIYFGLERGKWA